LIVGWQVPLHQSFLPLPRETKGAAAPQCHNLLPLHRPIVVIFLLFVVFLLFLVFLLFIIIVFFVLSVAALLSSSQMSLSLLQLLLLLSSSS